MAYDGNPISAFTTSEIASITNAALDFYIKGESFAQTIQEKPLLGKMMSKQKTFPGGKGLISIPIVSEYTTGIEGFVGDEQVSYDNPNNMKRVTFPWKEIHAGISLTLTELKIDGISVVDTLDGSNVSRHSERDVTVLTNILEHKLADMAEGWSRSFNEMLWNDGTQDNKLVPGLSFFIADDPTQGIVGGINRATAGNEFWRNRALVSTNAIAVSPTNQTLTKTLRQEVRQLKRYGGKPDILLAGSKFIEALEAEIHEKGIYTQSGFVNSGKTDIGMGDISMRGVGTFVYDPTLDDMNKSEYAYFIDSNNINLYVMEGEDRKTHNPARPHDKYVLYRAMTWTGATAARQLNGCGVYQIAS
jgi:hypothetical protein